MCSAARGPDPCSRLPGSLRGRAPSVHCPDSDPARIGTHTGMWNLHSLRAARACRKLGRVADGVSGVSRGSTPAGSARGGAGLGRGADAMRRVLPEGTRRLAQESVRSGPSPRSRRPRSAGSSRRRIAKSRMRGSAPQRVIPKTCKRIGIPGPRRFPVRRRARSETRRTRHGTSAVPWPTPRAGSPSAPPTGPAGPPAASPSRAGIPRRSPRAARSRRC